MWNVIFVPLGGKLALELRDVLGRVHIPSKNTFCAENRDDILHKCRKNSFNPVPSSHMEEQNCIKLCLRVWIYPQTPTTPPKKSKYKSRGRGSRVVWTSKLWVQTEISTSRVSSPLWAVARSPVMFPADLHCWPQTAPLKWEGNTFPVIFSHPSCQQTAFSFSFYFPCSP